MFDPDGPARKRRDAAERRRNSAKQRAYRNRQRKDLAVYGVTLSFLALDALIEWGWLQADESEDKRQVGRAITALLEDVARKK